MLGQHTLNFRTPCKNISDVGVAGIHRLFAHSDQLRKASVIIAVAGMEGALPSVMAGYVFRDGCPNKRGIWFPSLRHGSTPGVLNSCAVGLTVVVSITDSAACAAAAINDTRRIVLSPQNPILL